LQWQFVRIRHSVTLTETTIAAATKCNTIDDDRLNAQWAMNKCVKGISLPFGVEANGR